MTKKKIGVFIDHDIMIRHFVKTKVFRDLEDTYHVEYIFPDYPRRINSNIKELGLGRAHSISIDSRRAHRMRRFYQLTVFRDTRKRVGRDKTAHLNVFRRMLGWMYYLDWFRSSKLIYPIYSYFSKKRIGENLELNTLIEKLGLDAIVHPTVLEGLFVSDLIVIGRKLSIPTIYIMNSWDNPSTRAMMFGYPDKLLVWGEQSKNHSIKYLGMPPKNVLCCGAAQFEIYKEPPLIGRSSYRSEISVRSNQILVCYAGSSCGLDEIKSLDLLNRAINENSLCCKILYRPHPWKSFDDGELMLEAYDFENVIMDPYAAPNYRSRFEGKSIDINLIDYSQTNIVLHAVDALISPLSTIMLEASRLGIPVMAYSPEDSSEFMMDWGDTQNMDYMQEYFQHVKPVLCQRREKLGILLETLLSIVGDQDKCSELQKKSEYFVESNTESYSSILANIVSKEIEVAQSYA